VQSKANETKAWFKGRSHIRPGNGLGYPTAPEACTVLQKLVSHNNI